MTPSPKDKAKELVESYYEFVDCGNNRYSTKKQKENAKICAIIAVNLVISTIPTKPSKTEMERLDAIMYWIEVKQELEKL